MATALAVVHCVGAVVIVILVIAFAVSAKFRNGITIAFLILTALFAGLYFLLLKPAADRREKEHEEQTRFVPLPPCNVTAQRDGTSSGVTVSWRYPGDLFGIRCYHIWRRRMGMSQFELVQVTAGTVREEDFYSERAIPPEGGTYSYAISALSTHDQEGPKSLEATISIPPSR